MLTMWALKLERVASLVRIDFTLNSCSVLTAWLI